MQPAFMFSCFLMDFRRLCIDILDLMSLPDSQRIYGLHYDTRQMLLQRMWEKITIYVSVYNNL